MKFRKLGMLGLSSFIILSACGQNTDGNNKKDNDQTQERDKKSDETEKQSNDEVAENNQNTKNQSQGESNAAETTNEANNQNSAPITIDEAKSIAFNSEDILNFTKNKDELIYNKDKSNDDKIFIETPFGGINESVKHHAIIDRNTGKIIKTGGAITSPDGPIKAKNGYIDKDIYNSTADFYNTYVYKKGMPKFETANSDVPKQKYKELSNIVGNYWQKEQGYDNESNQSTSNNNQSQNENEKNQTGNDSKQSTNENTKNEQNGNNIKEDNNKSNHKQNNEEQQENNNKENTQNEEREDESNQQIEKPSNDDEQNSNTAEENNNQNNDENINNNNNESEEQAQNNTQDVESNSSKNDKKTSNVS
ncbi:hypothetical protein [Staphylococcus caeli]|uniref:Lipoprotein n=1 Tax=Staphylococcus caeli TaxID=2201815 RepID=A0A1D4KWP6_9STAP|nr:hypothetical protein [Staphylococcus caeli]AWM30164.1 hypothetical protein SCC82B_00024 [Staphylococcus caeli]SCS78272.1 Uncharacterised protein [Staphylococcus caeli]SCS97949.1 Uncharacterised protein [Staphylococcus caeli]